MITVSLDTWRTRLSLTVRASERPGLERNLRHLLTTEVARLDALASRFRDDSELSAVNRGAGKWVDVSWQFVTVLTACLDAARATTLGEFGTAFARALAVKGPALVELVV